LGKSFLATVFLKTVEAGWAGRGPVAPFLSAIRPILEYCSVVWHHGLTRTQSRTG